MRILVCFRPEPKLELLPASAWQEDRIPEEMLYQKPGWNCFEESALALSLALQKQSDGAVQLGALTIGNGFWSGFAQTLYALGFSEVIAVDEEPEQFRSQITSEIAAAVAQKYGYQILIAGRQSGLGGSGSVPLIAAEILRWPCISNVTNLSWDAGFLLVTNQSEMGVLTQQISGQYVLSVGNATLTTLPVPTLRDKLSLGRTPVTVLHRENLGLTYSPAAAFTLLHLRPVRQKRSGQILCGQTAELVRQLLAFCYEYKEV